MLWLGGFLSLDLTTSTPDALCPALDEARAAVHARVGEVRGEYHADFALVRADDGGQRLALTLREKEKEVLRRELPLDAAGCQDAAQTIALVLERYFDAIERPAARDTEAKPESVPAPAPRTTVVAPPRGAAAHASAPAGAASPAASQPNTPHLGLRAGLLYDRELGVAAVLGASFYPSALRLSSSWRVGLGLEVAPFFARRAEVLRDQEVEAFSLQGAVSVPLSWSRSMWRVSFGPWAQLRFQRAEAPAVARERAQYRAVPGVGGLVQVGLELAPSWGLLAGLAAGPQLRSAASRFILEGAAGQITVLVPDAWFGQGQLLLELKL